MIRMATIGTSSITTRTVTAARGVAGLRFTAAYSRDAARAAALASDLGMDASFDDLDSLLASPDVDAVYVASPNAVHAAQARAALAAGKHVLCEKPLVASVREFDELAALARERGVVLFEDMRSAHDPVMLRAVELLPSLGPVRRVSFNFSQRSARYAALLRGEHANIFDPALGGGALADLGVYCVHPLVRLFGTPLGATAAFVEVPTGTDGSGAALVTYPGMVAELSWSKSTHGAVGSVIEGEAGTLVLDSIADLNELTVAYADVRTLAERPDKEPDNITYSLRRFVELVSGADPATDLAWSRASIALLERLRSHGDLAR